MTNPCVVCIQNIEIKPKPGIFPCLGCEQMFCTQHVAFHRQELANELNLVIGDRNELQDALDRHQDKLDVSAQMNLIDEWVKKSIEQIHQVVDNVREQIIRLAEEQSTTLKGQFAQLTKQLDTFRENENFYEQNIEQLKEKCIILKRLLNPLNINVTVTDISSFLAQAVTLRQTEEKAVKPLSFVENVLKHQKPYKQIEIPHNGSIYVSNNVVLLRSNNDYTLIDLETNSLQSLIMNNHPYSILCYSPYLNGFLGRDYSRGSKIELLTIEGRNMHKVNEFRVVIAGISFASCLDDRLMLVCCETEHNNRLEEWSLKDFGNREKQSTDPIHLWRSPLTCGSEETITNMSFDDERVVLLITRDVRPVQNRIDFRTRNMFLIGCLQLYDYADYFHSILYRSKDGWLFGGGKSMRRTSHFTLIDDKLIRSEQQILSNYHIKGIHLIKYPSNKSVLAVYRENISVNMPTNHPSRLFLDLYEI